MAQLDTRVDDRLLADVDALVSEGVAATRSDAVRLGLEALVERHRRARIGQAILDGYRCHAQDGEELAGLRRTPEKAINGPVIGAGLVMMGGRQARTAIGAIAIAATAVLAANGGATSATTVGWRPVSTPQPNGSTKDLESVSCPTATYCMAAGYSAGERVVGPVVEEFNGRRWQLLHPLKEDIASTLSAVSCRSAKDCMVVGHNTSPLDQTSALSEHWNGSSWKTESMPGVSGGYLSSISCPTARRCLAVGGRTGDRAGEPQQELAEKWTSTGGWKVESLHNTEDGSLDGVSCVSASHCVAVGVALTNGRSGGDDPVESWNGVRWTAVTVPNLPGGDGLSAVSCSSSTSCVSVGAGTSDGRSSATSLILHDSGWTVHPLRGTATGSALSGVTCRSVISCIAVGTTPRGSSATVLIKHWDGSGWSTRAAVAPSGTQPGLDAVSCPTATACTAVGGVVRGSDRTLDVLVYRGTPT